MGVLLSSSGGADIPSWSDNSDFQSAWNNFSYVVNWMQNTVIFQFGNARFTFLSTLVAVVGFCIVVDLIFHLMGW